VDLVLDCSYLSELSHRAFVVHSVAGWLVVGSDRTMGAIRPHDFHFQPGKRYL
jgi:hypothetical protein